MAKTIKSKDLEVTDSEKISHLWKRCRNMESGDYFFFKQLHKVVNWFKKDLSEDQKKYLDHYMTKYGSTKETPKPKKKSEINPYAKELKA